MQRLSVARVSTSWARTVRERRASKESRARAPACKLAHACKRMRQLSPHSTALPFVRAHALGSAAMACSNATWSAHASCCQGACTNTARLHEYSAAQAAGRCGRAPDLLSLANSCQDTGCVRAHACKETGRLIHCNPLRLPLPQASTWPGLRTSMCASTCCASGRPRGPARRARWPGRGPCGC